MIRICHIIDEKIDWQRRALLLQLLAGLDQNAFEQKLAAATTDGTAPPFVPEPDILQKKTRNTFCQQSPFCRQILDWAPSIIHDWTTGNNIPAIFPGIPVHSEADPLPISVSPDYPADGDRARTRESLGISNTHTLVATPAITTEQGGHFAAFWATAIRSFLDKTITVLLPGNTPETRRLMDGAKKIKLPEIAIDPDPAVFRYEDLLAASDVLLYVPEQDSDNAACIPWAQAAGVPVIATKLPAALQWITDGETGSLLEPEKPKRLATKLASIIGKRDDLALMATQARQRLAVSTCVGAAPKHYSAIYKQILSQSR